jgi:hypothetical protein
MTSALFVGIPTCMNKNNTNYYQVILGKAFDLGNEKHLQKRFNDFRALDQALVALQLADLP